MRIIKVVDSSKGFHDALNEITEAVKNNENIKIDTSAVKSMDPHFVKSVLKREYTIEKRKNETA